MTIESSDSAQSIQTLLYVMFSIHWAEQNLKLKSLIMAQIERWRQA
ncbi:hypothetical protein VPUCM_3020 [Vibrio parahaemolyticus UCM-V493]|nr:hypothetical protein VPUCM_2986 [Vibrio parahaemolyticus UCM-V493]AHJ00979.1 hypothetical protein VPUCM_3020 [Vibrio parahaemolyticus UCM-V493]